MATPAINFAFPHPELTPINNRPNAASIQLLTRQLYANARSVHSTRGGGNDGHLALVMGPNEYFLRTGVPFIAPDHPGIQPDHANNATNAQITQANRIYDTNLSDFNTYRSVIAELRQQIIQAVDSIYYNVLEDPVFGYADVTPLQLLQHLTTTYGTRSIDDLEENRATLAADWDPDSPIEDLWTRIKDAKQYAAATEPISDDTAMRLTLQAIERTGVLELECSEWRRRDPAARTYANFQQHFNRANKERMRKLTAKAAGFHSANSAICPEGKPSATSAAATPPRPVSPEPPHVSLPSGVKMFYCWSHGLGKNRAHTSQTCQNRKDGHHENATADNMMGGCNTIMTGRRRE